MEKPGSSHALVLFKHFLAERWFGGPEFDTWVVQYPDLEGELRRLRDEWLAELRDAESPTLAPIALPGPRMASSLRDGEVMGGFRLVRRLGAGSSGEVWVAEELALGDRRVALKLLRPDLIPNPRALERFRRESLAGARIQHPGVVAVYSVGRHRGQPFIAMELVEDGITLGAWLEREKKNKSRDHFRRVAALVAQAAEAIGAVHAEGILHRDIKPANILVTPDDRPKIADFGLARLQEEEHLSQTGDVMGTFSYMSPEQIRGDVNELDARTDVFALGVTLYELLTFRAAFRGHGYADIARQIQLEDPPRPRRIRPQVPRDLDLICRKAIEKRAVDRYPDMASFGDDLLRYLAGDPPIARPSTWTGTVRKWTRRHPTAATAGVVGIVALLALAWILRAKGEELDLWRHELLLTRAEQSVDDGDLRQAGEWVEQADALALDDPRGQLLLAVGHAQVGNTPQSERCLEAARERGFSADPGQIDTAAEHHAYALYLRSRQDYALYPEAEAHLREALRLEPKRYGPYYTLYQLRSAARDVVGAGEALDALLSFVPSGEPFHDLMRALRAETAGEHEGALRILEELRQRPDMDEARLRELHWHRNAGRACQNLDRIEQAEGYLRTAIEVDPQDFGSFENLAYCCYKRILAGDRGVEVRRQAMDHANRALELCASLEVPRLVRAWLHSEEYAREPVGAQPSESASLRAARAELAALSNASDSPVGRRISVAAAARQIDSFLIRLELRGADIGRPETREGYARAVELDPDNTLAVFQLGVSSYQQEQYGAGLAALDATMARMDDPGWCASREPDLLAAIVIWHMGNAAKVGDRAAFQRSHARFERLLEEKAPVQPIELLNAAEFLAIAPPELRDCDLAWRLLEDHGLRLAFEESEAETIERIEEACP